MNDNIIEYLITALEFYADKYNYSPDISEPWELSNIDCDEGHKARGMLELIKSGDTIK